MYTLKIEDKSKLFFTSDSHFGHFNIAKLCGRPFESRSDMDKSLIANWNSVVPEDGIVVHCGDFTLLHKEDLKGYLKIAKKLNGRILLCRGNHDYVPLSIDPVENFIAIVDVAKIVVDGNDILACHYPMYAYPTDYQVFGHIHTLSDGKCHGTDEDVPTKLKSTQYDVGVDQNNYTPISYADLMEKLNQGTKEMDSNGHEYVDLGLPSGRLWATCNVGASSPTEYGKYFAWGDTVGYYDTEKHYFNWYIYKYGPLDDLTKYNTEFKYGNVDNKLTLDLSDDAAHVVMGGDWRMPTREDFYELDDNTTSEWRQLNGVYGRLFTSKVNGNTLFIPASGIRCGSTVYDQGPNAGLWSSSLYAAYPYDALGLFFNSDYVGPDVYADRCYGLCVRGVL